MWHPFTPTVAQQQNHTVTSRFDLICCFRLCLGFPTILHALHMRPQTSPLCWRWTQWKGRRCDPVAGQLYFGFPAAWNIFTCASFLMHRPFFFLNSRETFLKHYVTNNFHSTTIDLPFYWTKREARGHHLTFRATSLHWRRPGCPLTRTPPSPPHKHPDCHAASHYACPSSCHAHMPVCLARCHWHHLQMWLELWGLKNLNSIAPMNWSSSLLLYIPPAPLFFKNT